MKRISRYILLAALLLNAGYVMAWPKIGHETVAMLASEQLQPAVRKQVEAILGGDIISAEASFEAMCKQPSVESYRLHLNEELQPAGNEGDILFQIEKYADILRNRTSNSDSLQCEALCGLLHLVADMHCIAYVHIANEPLSEGFNFVYPKMTSLKGKVYMGKENWHKLWYGRFFKAHLGFTPQMFAENIVMAYASQRDTYAKGSPRDWAAEMGSQTHSLLAGMSEGIELPHKQVNLYEDIHEQNVAKAAYRLAVLLNEIFK